MSPVVAALILEFFTPTKYVLSMNHFFFQGYRISNPIPTVGTSGWIYSCRGMSITYWRVYHWIRIDDTEIASPIWVKLKSKNVGYNDKSIRDLISLNKIPSQYTISYHIYGYLISVVFFQIFLASSWINIFDVIHVLLIKSVRHQ